jgi:hypothetical protein
MFTGHNPSLVTGNTSREVKLEQPGTKENKIRTEILYFLKVFEYPAYFFKSIENNTVGSQ